MEMWIWKNSKGLIGKCNIVVFVNDQSKNRSNSCFCNDFL